MTFWTEIFLCFLCRMRLFFEERARVVKDLKPYSFRGIPDIRVIVFEGVSMMVMLQLPTKESNGRGNLHQGAIGVGIDLGSGFTTSAVWRRRFIDYYSGTRYLLRGIKIPQFKKVLNLAILAAKELNAKFLGVDITIDKEKGSAILELNAWPGLEIQLANLDGLKDRLERVKGIKPKSEKRGVRLAQDLFGEGEEIMEEEMLDKKILGAVEEIEIIAPTNNSESKSPVSRGAGLQQLTGNKQQTTGNFKILAKIDTGAWRSSVSFEIAKKLGIEEKGEETWVRSSMGEELRITVPLSFYLAGDKIETEVFLADRSKMQYKMIVGRRDLKKFIVDPSKNIYKTPLY